MKLISFGDDLVKNSSSPKILADMLGYDFEDLSELETSNQKIFRDVVNYVCENGTGNYFILIGWTAGERFEVCYDDKKFIFSKDKTEYPIYSAKILTKHQHVIFNEILVGQHRASEAFTLQQMLFNLKVNFYMYNTQDTIFFNEKTLHYLKALNGRYYHNPLNRSSSMKYFRLTEQQEKYNQKEWAEFLFNKISMEQPS